MVAALTSPQDMFRREVEQRSSMVDSQVLPSGVSDPAESGLPTFSTLPDLARGRYHVIRLADGERAKHVGTGELDHTRSNMSFLRSFEPDENGTERNVATGDLLVSESDYQAAIKLRDATWTSHIANGFGTMCGKIGIVIALAAVIGRGLLDSGAANRIVIAMRTALGERRTPLALVLSGFVIGIPVYFDTVFYLLLPLARALGKQTGRNYLLYILSIIVGATMAHSLVPPTPGPLLVASELGVPLGQMIGAGTVVGLIAASAGFLFAVIANRRMVIPIREDQADDQHQPSQIEADALTDGGDAEHGHGTDAAVVVVAATHPVACDSACRAERS